MRIMSEKMLKYGWLAGVLDAVIKTCLLLVVLVWITGGFDLAVGPISLSVHQAGRLLVALVFMLLVRWVLSRVWLRQLFGVSPRLQWIFRRLLEVGIGVHLILIPVVWRHGEFNFRFFESPDLGPSLGLICLMLLIRLVLGRNLAGLTVMISVFISLLLVFYGLEIFLRLSDADKLRQDAARNSNTSPPVEAVEKPPAQKAAPRDTAAVAIPAEKAFDPTLNDFENWTWGHRVVNNRFGFREREFSVPKKGGVFRIMVLGDSMTWGVGLAPPDRYTGALEELLTRDFPEQPVEVLNFGRPGGPTVAERDLLEELQEEVDPDLIVVGFCVNDPQPRSQSYSSERARLDNLYDLITGLRHVGLKKTYALLINRLDIVMAKLGAIPTWQEALDRTYQPDSREWGEFEQALSDIKRISDQRGLNPPVFILLIQEMTSDRPVPPYFKQWFAQAGEAAAERGFVVVDPTSRFLAELVRKDLHVNPKDGHPSAKCHRIYAEELLSVVQPVIRRDEQDDK